MIVTCEDNLGNGVSGHMHFAAAQKKIIRALGCHKLKYVAVEIAFFWLINYEIFSSIIQFEPVLNLNRHYLQRQNS